MKIPTPPPPPDIAQVLEASNALIEIGGAVVLLAIAGIIALPLVLSGILKLLARLREII